MYIYIYIKIKKHVHTSEFWGGIFFGVSPRLLSLARLCLLSLPWCVPRPLRLRPLFDTKVKSG